MFRNSNLTASWGRAFGLDLVDVYDRNREDPHVYDMLLGDEEVAIGVPGLGRFYLEWEELAECLVDGHLVLGPHPVEGELALPMTTCVRNKLQDRLGLRA